MRIIARVVEEFDPLQGVVVRTDPTCQMQLDGDRVCGRPATVRRNEWPHWSLFWCADHISVFDRRFITALRLDDLDVPSFIRRAVS